jgi:hypothetical protein
VEDEHRITNRQRVLKAGKIEFGGGAIDCTVRNISATGAALDVTSPVGIPAQFTLVTEGNHLPCRVVWRKEKRIGIAFDQKVRGHEGAETVPEAGRHFAGTPRLRISR